ncbi:hypothetical protein B0A52_04895 [Exophiala mesophila]|uniref:Phospholipid scramblase n=1 Tax=Exophiala mesophila TaxID=212818 RepID=A0A438N6Z8_EXOME|nr:hypothetical protein B0A52_04895 [Exophiala mesophila]
MFRAVATASRSAYTFYKPELQVCTIIYTRKITAAPGRRYLSDSTKPGQSATSRSSGAPPPPPADGADSTGQPPKPPSLADVLANTPAQDNTLLAPVHVPEDPNGILKSNHPATDILMKSGLVVQRELEALNIIAGIEQSNKYVILGPQGEHVGHILEHQGGIGKAVTRQMAKTHRAFTANIFDRYGREVLRLHRPFSWINSTARVHDAIARDMVLPPPDSSTSAGLSMVNHEQQWQLSSLPIEAMPVIGEAHSQWAPLRRKYNLFLSHEQARETDLAMESHSAKTEHAFRQFAAIDEPFLSWDFSLRGKDKELIGSVNRAFRGFGRELFTDTGSYALRMDSAAMEEGTVTNEKNLQLGQSDSGSMEVVSLREQQQGMTLDQRAVMLATAITLDIDYFSRHSSSGGGFMPLWFWGGSGAAEAGGAGTAAGAGVGEAGVAVGTAGRAASGTALGEAGAVEGAIGGAGTVAGYEAWSRGSQSQSTSPSTGSENAESPSQSSGFQEPGTPGSPSPSDDPWTSDSPNQSGDSWGAGDADPWKDGAGSGSGSGGDGEGGGGLLSELWNSFFGD